MSKCALGRSLSIDSFEIKNQGPFPPPHGQAADLLPKAENSDMPSCKSFQDFSRDDNDTKNVALYEVNQ